MKPAFSHGERVRISGDGSNDEFLIAEIDSPTNCYILSYDDGTLVGGGRWYYEDELHQ